MARLGDFRIDDLEELSRTLRTIGDGSVDMREAARRVTEHLHEHLCARDGGPACAAIELHRTIPLRSLSPMLREQAIAVDPASSDHTTCLVRLSRSSGDDDTATARRLVQPLTPTTIEQQPIVVAMFESMGIDIDAACDPVRALSLGIHRRSLDGFVASDLLDGAWVSDDATRARLARVGVSSLVVLGGGLPSGDLFLLFLFACEPISERSGRLLPTLATAIKATLIPYTNTPLDET